MCQHCEENMTTIAERTGIPRETVAEVYAAQKAIIAEEEVREYTEAIEEAERIAGLIATGAIDVPGLAAEVEESPLSIPGFIMEALVQGIGGPVVVIGARPVDGAEAMVTIQSSGAGGPGLAAKLCQTAADTLSSPLAETGGVTAEGGLISPMRRRSTRPEQ